jgi:hypothetical protein
MASEKSKEKKIKVVIIGETQQGAFCRKIGTANNRNAESHRLRLFTAEFIKKNEFAET